MIKNGLSVGRLFVQIIGRSFEPRNDSKESTGSNKVTTLKVPTRKTTCRMISLMKKGNQMVMK